MIFKKCINFKIQKKNNNNNNNNNNNYNKYILFFLFKKKKKKKKTYPFDHSSKNSILSIRSLVHPAKGCND